MRKFQQSRTDLPVPNAEDFIMGNGKEAFSIRAELQSIDSSQSVFGHLCYLAAAFYIP